MRSKIAAQFSLLLILLAIVSCTPSKEEMLVGDWKVQWVTDPASYPGVDEATNFTMNGEFLVSESGDITINAYGYVDCIFGVDTLSHTQKWKIINDTLSLFNTPGEHGMTYKILEISEEKIKLQQLDDIFLFLTK